MTIRNQNFELEGNAQKAGFMAHAEGQATQATGDTSHAENSASIASGIGAHAEGQGTTASGNFSHAEGYSSIASAFGAHAEGRLTVASGQFSHAGGYNSKANRQTQWSHATIPSGVIAPLSYAQTSILNFGGVGVSGTVTQLMADGSTTAAPSSTSPNVLTIPVKATIMFRFMWTAHRTDAASTNMSSAGEAVGAVARDSTGNAYFCGTPTQTAFNATSALATIQFVLNLNDATNNYLQLNFTPTAPYQVVVTGTLLFHEMFTTTF